MKINNKNTTENPRTDVKIEQLIKVQKVIEIKPH